MWIRSCFSLDHHRFGSPLHQTSVVLVRVKSHDLSLPLSRSCSPFHPHLTSLPCLALSHTSSLCWSRRRSSPSLLDSISLQCHVCGWVGGCSKRRRDAYYGCRRTVYPSAPATASSGHPEVRTLEPTRRAQMHRWWRCDKWSTTRSTRVVISSHLWCLTQAHSLTRSPLLPSRWLQSSA